MKPMRLLFHASAIGQPVLLLQRLATQDGENSNLHIYIETDGHRHTIPRQPKILFIKANSEASK